MKSLPRGCATCRQVRLYLPEETAEAQLAELRALLAELPGRYPACEFGR